MILKKIGYFLPIVCLQLLHLSHSGQSFWDDFVCADLATWLHVWTFTRFIFEPSVHVVSSMVLRDWVSDFGVASHLLMTYVSWGVALLMTDHRWFFPPQGTSGKTRRIAHGFALAFLAVVVLMYTWMAFITCRFYHNAVDWALALVTASVVLSLLAIGVRSARTDLNGITRTVVNLLAGETCLAVALLIFNGFDTSGALEKLLTWSLRFVSAVLPANWCNVLDI